MQQGAQNALDKLRKRSPKGRRASARLSIYTYTRAPHNVNGEIAHCFPKSTATSTVSGRLRTHKPFLVLSSGGPPGLTAATLRSPPCHDGRFGRPSHACSLATGAMTTQWIQLAASSPLACLLDGDESRVKREIDVALAHVSPGAPAPGGQRLLF
jgi:hypothetical protein